MFLDVPWIKRIDQKSPFRIGQTIVFFSIKSSLRQTRVLTRGFIRPTRFIISLFFSHSHQAPDGLSFLEWTWSATTTGVSYEPQSIRNWSRHAPNRTSPWDPGPRYPREIPWDQNFCVKIFLLSFSNDVILCIFGFMWAKLEKNRKTLSF